MSILKSRLKIIDGYIIGKYLGTFVYTLSIFVIIIIIFDLSEKLDDFLGNNLSFWQVITLYYAGSIPFYVQLYFLRQRWLIRPRSYPYLAEE
jgi:lipopolysaccharide export system permease protein